MILYNYTCDDCDSFFSIQHEEQDDATYCPFCRNDSLIQQEDFSDTWQEYLDVDTGEEEDD